MGIDKYAVWYYHSLKLSKSNRMAARYEIGQKVIIRPKDSQDFSLRGSELESYTGQSGYVNDYYWISPHTGETFYIYSVQVGAAKKEIILYEDEMEACID